MSYVSNVAHVEGGSGTLVMPAHSPYDRQMLREHVNMLAGRVPTLTLGVHGVRWTVSRGHSTNSHCTTCTQTMGRLICSRNGDVDTSCLDCAMRPGHHAREKWGNS